jgi:hypothetical protein
MSVQVLARFESFFQPVESFLLILVLPAFSVGEALLDGSEPLLGMEPAASTSSGSTLEVTPTALGALEGRPRVDLAGETGAESAFATPSGRRMASIVPIAGELLLSTADVVDRRSMGFGGPCWAAESSLEWPQ